jgi:hypothetical protein
VLIDNSLPMGDPFRRPIVTPADGLNLQCWGRVDRSGVGSILEADWGSDPRPIHTVSAASTIATSGETPPEKHADGILASHNKCCRVPESKEFGRQKVGFLSAD